MQPRRIWLGCLQVLFQSCIAQGPGEGSEKSLYFMSVSCVVFLASGFLCAFFWGEPLL